MRKFHVFIIESPSPVDLYHMRFEGEALKKALRLSGISSTNKLIVNKESFQAAFNVALGEYFDQKEVQAPPIIHISAHGSNHGIGLTSGEVVSWDELKELLLPVNKIVGGVMLCVSSCESAHATKMAMSDGDFPFGAVAVNSGKPTWAETNIAFTTFYHLFFKGIDITEIEKSMRAASGNNDFYIFTAEKTRKMYEEMLNSRIALSKIPGSTIN